MKTLTPKQTKIETIFPYENNAKLHPQDQIDKIIRSIELTGFDQPLVANNENGKLILIKGHGRLEAAKKMGLTEVPCVVLNIPIETANKARLMDNKAAESPYDVEKLLAELQQFADDDLIDTGFSDLEVKTLLQQLEKTLDEVKITQNPTFNSNNGVQEIDPTEFEFEHTCPKCGFGYND